MRGAARHQDHPFDVQSSVRTCSDVALTVPNIIGYTRISLLALSLASGARWPLVTLNLFFLNFALDGVDGYTARMLRQETAFGALLDVFIDIASRAILWAWALPAPLSALPILLESFTFVCTHAAGGAGWKSGGCFAGAPPWVHAVMNFKSPAGSFAIAGLMGCPMSAWAFRYAPESMWSSRVLGAVLCLGRCLAASVEVWAIIQYLQGTIQADTVA